MRLSPVRTIWISVISIFAMLMSGFVASAPLMTFQMLSDSYAVAQTQASQAQDKTLSVHVKSSSGSSGSAVIHCGGLMLQDKAHAMHDLAMPESVAPEQTPVNCDSEQSTPHTCCSASCATVIAFLPPINTTISNQTQPVLIPIEKQGAIIERSQSLYRPPIA
ncbi:hypothetical protein [Photobacterium sp. J15]|uniref:hypothetical protein n=1 Tax=Photobacterium sp. J15 TaxID=265901 RepID=UPI0007E4033D|nr:hypothetical protein [Photobacterium sp. J15]